MYYRKYYKELIYIHSMTKTQTLEAETTQKGMTVLLKVIEIIDAEIDELYFVRFRHMKSKVWITENASKIKILRDLRSKALLLGRPSEVKE